MSRSRVNTVWSVVLLFAIDLRIGFTGYWGSEQEYVMAEFKQEYSLFNAKGVSFSTWFGRFHRDVFLYISSS
ncbi:hypothetical protein BKA65DRAFT_503090 [Rhexocercosporidium sp. MPI-PUGE-AT-0058]|nr:hypothetical protein BKA65DRAFT_503090 [Rhexocercosporidium sp. MPI-PUGE-AT-0058]